MRSFFLDPITWLLALFGFACLLLSTDAFAHQAPLGWAYGIECCSNKDCKQVSNGDVNTVEGGYLIVATGEIIPYNDSRIKRSRDEFYHRCALLGNFESKRSLCLYVPDMGF